MTKEIKLKQRNAFLRFFAIILGIANGNDVAGDLYGNEDIYFRNKDMKDLIEKKLRQYVADRKHTLERDYNDYKKENKTDRINNTRKELNKINKLSDILSNRDEFEKYYKERFLRALPLLHSKSNIRNREYNKSKEMEYIFRMCFKEQSNSELNYVHGDINCMNMVLFITMGCLTTFFALIYGLFYINRKSSLKMFQKYIEDPTHKFNKLDNIDQMIKAGLQSWKDHPNLIERNRNFVKGMGGTTIALAIATIGVFILWNSMDAYLEEQQHRAVIKNVKKAIDSRQEGYALW